MKELIEKLKASEQNASGMFEIDEDTICALMGVLQKLDVEYDWAEARSLVRSKDISFPAEAAFKAVNSYRHWLSD